MTSEQRILFNGEKLTIEAIGLIATRQAKVVLSEQAEFVGRIDRGARWVEQLLQQQGYVYGVTTGFGDSGTITVPLHLTDDLAKNLYTFHGCGLGAYFDEAQTRAIMAARLASFTQGYSGVRYRLLQQLTTLIQLDILPLMPQEGSVGASGDLTPLSYLAAVLAGERQVNYEGKQLSTVLVFAQHGIELLTLKPKEGLAVMNGTAVMTGLACLAYLRAAYLSQLASRITTLAVIALNGNYQHFDEKLFQAKPHAGQNLVAERIRVDLNCDQEQRSAEINSQDRYSLRCAPHVIGVLEDSLPWLRQFIENELNSANDNPLIDPDNGRVLHGGHFYGGHIAFAMDCLKTAVANIADLLDRQMAQLSDVKFNDGLPANLSGASGVEKSVNHGFKAVQIAVSAWTAESLKLTMPASVFSRSTECHNQDKVSMGTIAARDCLRILELSEQVAAAVLLAAVQGVELRGKIDHIGPQLQEMIRQVRELSPFLNTDRALEHELRRCVAAIQNRHWTLYA